MSETFVFEEKSLFLKKLRELVDERDKRKVITTMTPYSVHEADEMLKSSPSKLNRFTLTGALCGLVTGFSFAIYTVLRWPLMAGGKPIVAVPPYFIIAFELTVLFGSIASVLGFLILSRLPSVKEISSAQNVSDNKFVIMVDRKK